MELALALAVLVPAVGWLAWRLRRRSSDDRRIDPTPAHAAPPLPPIERPGDPELEAFLIRQIRKRSYYFRATLASGQEIAVGYSPEEDWVDVAARRRLWRDEATPTDGPYEEFSYHMRQNRWSFGAEPPNAAEISAIVVSHLGDRTQRRRTAEEQSPERTHLPWPEVPPAKRRRRSPGNRMPGRDAQGRTAPPPGA